MEYNTPDQQELLYRRIRLLPPIVQAAIIALIKFEDVIDPMGYDLSYYQEDLPKIVEEAIKPWKAYDDEQ